MSPPIASETRRPFSASSETSACSWAGPSSAGDEQGAELVPVKPDGVGLVVKAQEAHVHRR
jgi:hypothetical protein